MKKLLITILLFNLVITVSLSQHKQASTPHAPQSKTTVPSRTVEEFCINYERYFFDLPEAYRLEIYGAMKEAGVTPPSNVTSLTSALAQSEKLREGVYYSLYRFCAARKYMYREALDVLLFKVLYHTLHMNTVTATILTTHIIERYDKHPKQSSTATDKPKQLVSTVQLEASGWTFANKPSLIIGQDTPAGEAMFRIEIKEDRTIGTIQCVRGNLPQADIEACKQQIKNTTLRSSSVTKSSGQYGYVIVRFYSEE